MEIGEKFLPDIGGLLTQKNLKLSDISEIYFLESSVSWNSSRLITLFVKTVSSFSDTKLFLKRKNIEKKEDNDDSSLFKENKLDLKSFKLIKRPEFLNTFYKKCKITNI